MAAVRPLLLTLELVISFAILKDSFADEAMLESFPPAVDRWTSGLFVKGATATLFSAAGNQLASAQSDGKGRVALALPPRAPQLDSFRVEVTPPTGMNSPTGQPAGPALDPTGHKGSFIFRKFDLTFDTFFGFVSPFSPAIHQLPETPPKRARANPTPARYAQIIPSFFGHLFGNRVIIDWRPDWIRPSPKTITARRTNTQNPFVKSQITNAKQEPVLVVHQTSDESRVGRHIGELAFSGAKKGIHYLIDVDGHAIKIVHDIHQCSHAGASSWRGGRLVNRRSIGIEQVHHDLTRGKYTPRPFPQEQTNALIRVMSEILARFPTIELRNVVAHADIRTRDHSTTLTPRIYDPGESFDWGLLEAAGVALQRTPLATPAAGFFGLTANSPPLKRHAQNSEVKALKQALFDIGYSVAAQPLGRKQLSTKFDEATEHAVKAFQRRWFTGPRLRYVDVSHPHPSFGKKRTPLLGQVDFDTAKAIAEVADVQP